ncbi:NAD-P-binding protein [Trametes elegans]|nr:NAD-P-binding protein [Trametes elegans]
MPAITSGKILVTGANGFIAAWTVKTFLDAGFSVRGTVRSQGKAEDLKGLFSSYGDRFEAVVTPDMTQEAAFDEAVVGVDAIVHTASPVHLHADEPAEIIEPAVNGTLGVLRSAVLPAARATVKRVVYLSTCGAIVNRYVTEPHVYDERDWNDVDVRLVEEKGRDASPLSKYSASKTLAERRAWAFVEENKGTLPWDFAVVNPPWVFGTVLGWRKGSGPEKLNDSNKLLYDALAKGSISVKEHCLVDVRDLAHVILLAVTKAAAGGQRFIATVGPFQWRELAGLAHKISNKTRALDTMDESELSQDLVVFNAAKSKEVLGMVYRSKEETIRDVLTEWEANGWL